MIKQLKCTIEKVIKIPMPLKPILLVLGNRNLADFVNGIL